MIYYPIAKKHIPEYAFLQSLEAEACLKADKGFTSLLRNRFGALDSKFLNCGGWTINIGKYYRKYWVKIRHLKSTHIVEKYAYCEKDIRSEISNIVDIVEVPFNIYDKD